VGDGWIDRRDMLFGEKGLKKLREFAESINWNELQWEKERWKGEERRKGREVVERLKRCGNLDWA